MATLTIDRKIGMYGASHRINAHTDTQEYFAVAAYDAPSKKWGISIVNVDGSQTEYAVDFVGNSQDAIEHVEAIIRLAFRQNYQVRRAA